MFSLLAESDIERCMDLAERVGWPRERFKWELLLSLGRGHARREEDGRLSAMVVLPRFEGARFVAMMVVDPSLQGQGVGEKLLRHALADEPAMPTLLYATSSGQPLYEKLGFTAVDSVRRHIGVPTIPSARGARTATAEDARHMVEEDARAFGYRRERLFQLLLSRAARAVVDDRGGFAVRWNNGATDVIGPVIAHDEQAASALIDAALEGATGTVRIDVPVEWDALSRHLLELGLADKGIAPLMTHPERRRPGQRERYFALVLQAFG